MIILKEHVTSGLKHNTKLGVHVNAVVGLLHLFIE